MTTTILTKISKFFTILALTGLVVACSKKTAEPTPVVIPASDPKVVTINGGLLFKDASLMPMTIQTETIYNEIDEAVKDGYEFIISGEDTGIVEQPIRLSKDNVNFTPNAITVSAVGGKVKFYAIVPTKATDTTSYKIQVRAKNTPNVFGRFFINVNPAAVASIEGIKGSAFEDLSPYDGVKQEFENWSLIGDGERDTYVYVGPIRDQYGNLVRSASVRMTIDRGTLISQNPATVSDGVGVFRIQSISGTGLIALRADALDSSGNVLATASNNIELVRPYLSIDEDGNFGDVLVNQELRRTFTLRNSGNTSATNLLYTVGLPFNIDNSQSTCVTKTRLRPNETCTLTVAFNGGVRQEFQSELRVNGSPTTVAEAKVIKPLTSRVVAPASLTVSNIGFDFGSQVCGGNYQQEFFVKNTGDITATGFKANNPKNSLGQVRGDVIFILPLADGAPNSDPESVINCGNVIPPGRKCRVLVQFNPTALVTNEPLTGSVEANGVSPFNIVVRAASTPGGPVGTLPLEIFDANGNAISAVDVNSTIVSTVRVGPIVDGCGLTVSNGTQLQAEVTAGSLLNTLGTTNAGVATFAWQSTNDINAIGSQVVTVTGGAATGNKTLVFRGVKLVGAQLNGPIGQVLNDRTKNTEFRITNEGTVAATNLNFNSDPQGLPWFTIDNTYAGGCEDARLNPGESCTVRAIIDPRAANNGQPLVGAMEATFVLKAIENGQKEVRLPMAGVAVPPPKLTFESAPLGNPPVIGLGSFPAGAQVRRTLSLTNTSSEARVNNLTLSVAPPFTLFSTDCVTFLEPLATCSVVVDLNTNSKGTYSSIIQALGEASISTAQATVSATVTSAPAFGTIPMAFDRNSVPADQTSVINVTVGPIKDSFGNPVAPGTVVEVVADHGLMSIDADGDGITQATTGVGSDEGKFRFTIRSRSLTEITSFTITTQVKDGATVLASGSRAGSFTGALLSFTVDSLDFGQVAVGALDFRTVRLQNTGNEAATGINFSLSSQANMSLNGQSNCTTLNPGQHCDITILFNPPQTGVINATVTANGNGYGILTDAVAITATAVDAAKIVAGLNYNGATNNYNQTNIELVYAPGGSNSTSFKVRNVGQDPLVDLVVSSGLRPGELVFTPEAACSTLTNGQECNVGVSFSPSATVSSEFMGAVDITGESASRVSTTSINLIIKAPHLVFTTAQSSLLQGSCGAFQIQLQDANDAPQNATSTINLSLTHTNSGAFYSNSGCTAAITSTAIAAGSSLTPVFYYKPTATGSNTITAFNTNSVLTVSTLTTSYQPLAISPLTPQTNIGGTVQFSATGGVAPYTFSIQSGTGSTITAGGLFTASGGGSFVVRVTDNIGAFAETTLSTASWPKGLDGVLSLTTPGTYRIQRNGSSSTLQIVNTSTSAVVLNNFGAYVNDGNKNNQACRADFSSATIASGVTLLLDTGCKWLVMGVTGNFALNGTIEGRFLTDLNASYAAEIPDDDAYTLVYFVNQGQGGSGGYGGTGFHGGAVATGDDPGPGGAQSQGGGGGGGGGDCISGYGSHNGVYPAGGGSSRTGGGGGGGCNSYNNAISGGGGGGGSYGRHGQGIFIRVFGTLSGSGTVNASGENGGNGATGGNGTVQGIGWSTNSAAGGGGGGGGGAGGTGGKAIVQYSQNTSSVTVLANGGTGGAGGNGGIGVVANSSNGTNGYPGSSGAAGAGGTAKLTPLRNYYVDFTSTKTIKVPSGISTINIEGCGGGAGGGGGTSGLNWSGSGGGGGGGGSLGGLMNSISVATGDTLSITVGNAGGRGPGQIQGGCGIGGGGGGDTILFKNGVEVVRFLGANAGGGVCNNGGGGGGGSRDGGGDGGNGAGAGGTGASGGSGGTTFVGGSGGAAGSGGGGGGGGAGRFSIGAAGGTGGTSEWGADAIPFSCSGGGGSGGAWYSSGSYGSGGQGSSGLLKVEFVD